MATPRMGVPELVEGQAVPETTVNEQIRYVEQGASLFNVKDKDLTAAPGAPSDGGCYIVGTGATGTWSGKDNNLAFYLSSSWHYVTPIEGTAAYVQDEDCFYMFHTTWFSWNAEDSTIWDGTSKRRFISAYNLYTAAAPVALTSGATITPDGDNGINFTLTLAHDATLANPSNFKVGQSGLIVITQDGSGNQTLAYGTNWKFPGGAPVLSTGAGEIDVLAYYVVTASIIIATLTKDYSS